MEYIKATLIKRNLSTWLIVDGRYQDIADLTACIKLQNLCYSPPGRG